MLRIIVLTIFWHVYDLCDMRSSTSSSLCSHSTGVGRVGTQRVDSVCGGCEQRVEHSLLICQSGDVDSISLNNAVSLVRFGRIPVHCNCSGAECSNSEISWNSWDCVRGKRVGEQNIHTNWT